MGLNQSLVAENSDRGQWRAILRMQEANELRQIMKVRLVTTEQRMVEGDSNAAVAVLDIEHHGVSARLRANDG